MWGTVTPDERPTDLGVNDGGFNFRGTDDAREFIWSQTQWIEVTEVRYGTHAGRPNPLDVVNGALYVEFDRGGVIYQNQNNVWKYLAGTMFGTLVPDQRPTDLGVNDAGFDFRGTDQQREFIWSQTVWVEVTPNNNTIQLVLATGDLTLTTALQDIPGATLTLANAGRYWINGVFDFDFAGGDAGNVLIGRIDQGGALAGQTAPLLCYTANTVRTMVSQQSFYTAAAAGSIVKLQAQKTGGAGGSVAHGTNTTLSAIWIGP
jgi:hypothetical protein